MADNLLLKVTSPNAEVSTHVFPDTKNGTLVLQAQPNSKIEVVNASGDLANTKAQSAGGAKFKLKKRDNDLLIESDDELGQVEIKDFYTEPNVQLVGDVWTYTESELLGESAGGVAATANAAAAAAQEETAALLIPAAAPAATSPWLIAAGGVGLAAAGGGGGGGGSKTTLTVPSDVRVAPNGGTVVANTINSTTTHVDFSATIVAGQATGGKAEFYVGGVLVGTDSSIAAGDTKVTFTTSDGTPTNAELRAAIAAGGVVSVKLYDATGNAITATGPTLVRDLLPPTTPSAPNAYKDNAGSIQNDSSVAPVTDDTTPGIQVGANLTDTPTLYVDGVKVAATYDRAAGTLTPDKPLAEGVHSFSYTLTDAAGNESGKSNGLTIEVDTTRPPAPAAPSAYKDNAGSIQNDSSVAPVTDDTTPGIQVGANLTDTPTLYVDGVKVDADYDSAKGTLTPKAPLTEGVHNLSYTLTDALGTESLPSEVRTIEVDTTRPATPSLSAYNDDTGSIQKNNSVASATDDTTPGFQVGANLTDNPTLYVDGGKVDADYDATTGTLTPKTPLTEGRHIFNFTLTDAAGNESDKSADFTLKVDTTKPLATFLLPLDASQDNGAGGYLSFSFDSEVQSKGTANVLIRRVSDNGVAVTLDAANALVVPDPSTQGVTSLVFLQYSNLLADVHYYVEILDGAFADSAGNPYGGTSATGAAGWDFTTANASVAIDNVAGDNVINADENATSVVVSGLITATPVLQPLYTAASVLVEFMSESGVKVVATSTTYEASTGRWTATMPPNAFAEGNYTVSVTINATGAAPKITTNSEVKVDLTGASLTGVSSSFTNESGVADALGGKIANEQVKLTFTFDENVYGLNNTSVPVNGSILKVGGTAGGIATLWSGVDGTKQRTLTYTVSAGQNGQIEVDWAALSTYLTAQLKDVDGNHVTPTTAFPIALPVVDTVKPSLTFSGDGNAFYNSVTGDTTRTSLRVSSTEPGAIYLIRSNRLAESDFKFGYFDRTNWISNIEDSKWNKVSVSAANTPVSLPVAGLENGDYYIVATDRAGNSSYVDNLTKFPKITIDNINPTPVSFMPSNSESTRHYWQGVGVYNSYTNAVYKTLKVRSNEDGDIYLLKTDLVTAAQVLGVDGQILSTLNIPGVSTNRWRKTSASAGQIAEINMTDLAGGDYYLVSVDKAGNTSHAAANDIPFVQIDNARPTLTVAINKTNYIQSEKVSVTSTEDGYVYFVRVADANVDRGHIVSKDDLYTEVFATDLLAVPIPSNAIQGIKVNANTAIDFNLTNLGDGRFAVVAVDKAGNTSHVVANDLDNKIVVISHNAPSTITATDAVANLDLVTETRVGENAYARTKFLVTHNDLDALLNHGADTVTSPSANVRSGVDLPDTYVDPASGKTWKLLSREELTNITLDKTPAATGSDLLLKDSAYWTSDFVSPDVHLSQSTATVANAWSYQGDHPDTYAKYAVFQLL